MRVVHGAQLYVLAGVVALGGCSSAEETTSHSSGEASTLIQTSVEIARPGGRVTLLRFPRVGRLNARCGERPGVTFRIGGASAAVGVDAGRGGTRVENLNRPGQALRSRLPRSGLQRWHIASRHGDGDRIVTASVEVTPVVGGRRSCMFSAQSTRTGRIP